MSVPGLVITAIVALMSTAGYLIAGTSALWWIVGVLTVVISAISIMGFPEFNSFTGKWKGRQ